MGVPHEHVCSARRKVVCVWGGSAPYIPAGCRGDFFNGCGASKLGAWVRRMPTSVGLLIIKKNKVRVQERAREHRGCSKGRRLKTMGRTDVRWAGVPAGTIQRV